MTSEVDALMGMNCFAFKAKGYHPGTGWQRTTPHIVFDVEHDLRRKARLMAGGHFVNVMDTPVYSSTVKSICIRLLHVISHKA
eukprot:4289802-Ditylum_brightwellii.AAC.1